ncbi:uncharacterized protein LOC128952058 [Oppia nitens]|uniref:uncharacterized protein LOC128952058 n=1 Tax=Oppia nitens TaxID=1686743 RepID=UPI0023DA0CC6|nr:uncharacterized protein LOC128952058 [Oppia nitens]
MVRPKRMVVDDEDSADEILNIYKDIGDKNTDSLKSPKSTTNNGKQDSVAKLRDENARLKKLAEQYCLEKDNYKSQSKEVINKASVLKERDRASTLQILELLRLNSFLINCFPEAEREALYEKFEKLNSPPISSIPSQNGDKKKSLSASKKPEKVNQISNYFKSTDKLPGNGFNESFTVQTCNDSTEDESAANVVRRRSPRKSNSINGETSGPPAKQRKMNVYESGSGDGQEVSTNEKPAKTGKKKTKDTTAEIANETTSDNKTESDGNTTKEKPKRKPGPKRTRKPRVPERRGFFPCSFDTKECREMMYTKEQFDFHMNGHYDAKYTCPFCAYTGPTIQIIKRHIYNLRESAEKLKSEGKPLDEDEREHIDKKYYKCYGCKVCNIIYDKSEKRCEHIQEDSDNECDFMHDIDYQFKDHLKRHFNETFSKIKDKSERREKIKPLVDKFVEEEYFVNKAKKQRLIEKYQKSNDEDDNGNDGVNEEPNIKEVLTANSEDDWDE